MARPTTFKFKDFVVETGDGASPEVFGRPCGLTSWSFNGQAQTNDTNIPDCDDPEAAAWLERDVVSLTRDITGSGILAEEYLQTWDDWFVSADVKNARITLGDLQWTGSYLLTGFEVSAQVGDKAQINITLQSDGQITRATVSD